MRTAQITFKLDPADYEEILLLCKERRQSVSEVVRGLIRQSIIATCEARTDSQFMKVEKRIAGLEATLVKWCIQASTAIAKSNYYVEQLALFETTESEQLALRAEAEKQARYFLQSKHPESEEYGLAPGPK